MKVTTNLSEDELRNSLKVLQSVGFIRGSFDLDAANLSDLYSVYNEALVSDSALNEWISVQFKNVMED
jgi:hypothetical protein